MGKFGLLLLIPLAMLLPVHASAACRSRSVGYPDAGKLEGGRQLHGRNAPLRLQSFTLVRDFRWGSCELVDGLEALARDVVPRLGLRVLRVGNLSQQHGGEMPISTSHESGRDVDFPLFTTSASGKPLSGLYLHFDAEGRSRSHGGRFRFDVARNWLLIRAIFAQPAWKVERLVLAPGLRKLVLAHAAQSGVAPAELAAVSARLIPPWPGVKLHDNHLHLRIACTDADRAAGCKDRPMPGRALVGEPKTGASQP